MVCEIEGERTVGVQGDPVDGDFLDFVELVGGIEHVELVEAVVLVDHVVVEVLPAVRGGQVLKFAHCLGVVEHEDF